MPLIPAKCTQCGANIEVDSAHEAGICPHCGTAFITEKAVNNYYRQTNVTANISQTTNISAQTVHLHQDEINRFFVIEDGTLVKYNGKLKKIKVPEGVVALGDHVFSKVDYNEVILPSTLLSIGEGAFQFEPDGDDEEHGTRREGIIRKIDLSACTSLCDLGKNALADISVPVLILPKSLQSVEPDAFAQRQVLCVEGDAAEFEENFGDCYQKETVYTPPGKYTPSFCAFKNILVGGFRKLGKTDDGFIYVLGEDGAYVCAYTKKIDDTTELHIPDKIEGERVKEVSLFLYRQALGAHALYLPEGLTEIPDHALDYFGKFTDLQFLYIPASVKIIGEEAVCFYNPSSSSGAAIKFAPKTVLTKCNEQRWYNAGTQIVNPPTLPSGKTAGRKITVSVEAGVKAIVRVYQYDYRKTTGILSLNATQYERISYLRSGFTKLHLEVKPGERKSVVVSDKTEIYLDYGDNIMQVSSSGDETYIFKKKLFGRYNIVSFRK